MSDITTPAPQPEKPKISKTAGCFGVIILICVIGWIADMAGCNPSSTTSESGSHVLTKAEWRQKALPY